MNRREVIHNLLVSLPGIAYGSSLMTAMTSCETGNELSYRPQVLSNGELLTLEDAVERIIPTTDTPGAKEAGVAQYVDRVLAQVRQEEDAEIIIAGLSLLDERSRSEYSNTFTDLDESDQYEVLKYFAQQTKQHEDRFFSLLKSLTIYGYYTSEIGASQELEYVHTAGTYKDMKLEEVGKNFY